MGNEQVPLDILLLNHHRQKMVNMLMNGSNYELLSKKSLLGYKKTHMQDIKQTYFHKGKPCGA